MTIPHNELHGMLRRLLLVWAVALVIAVALWANTGYSRLDVQLVYSYAISTFIWLLTDMPRYVLRRWLRSQAPHYWPSPGRAALMLLIGIPLGYALGTWVGDSYVGHSTWDLIDHNRPRFAGMLLSSVAISAAFVLYFYQRGKAQTLQQQATQAQLMLLQSQLQPHMLFNTLAHVRALIVSDPSRAQTMLDHLDDYLRASLQASRQPWHTLAQEFARIQDYLALMAIRMGPRLQVQMDLPDALRGVMVPSFILQPLVENAIAHGLEPKVEDGLVRVAAHLQTHEQGSHAPLLCLTVQDTGVGWREDEPPSGTEEKGYGIEHVRERLMQAFGTQAQLHLQCQAHNAAPGATGCSATLRWPLALSPTGPASPPSPPEP